MLHVYIYYLCIHYTIDMIYLYRCEYWKCEIFTHGSNSISEQDKTKFVSPKEQSFGGVCCIVTWAASHTSVHCGITYLIFQDKGQFPRSFSVWIFLVIWNEAVDQNDLWYPLIPKVDNFLNHWMDLGDLTYKCMSKYFVGVELDELGNQ